jgi:guanyl-specific ribonuclease Sa
MRQKKSFFAQTLLPILVLAALLFVVKYSKSCTGTAGPINPTTTTAPNTQNEGTAPKSNTGKSVKVLPKGGKIPAYALEVLEYVQKNGDAPPGIVGGRTFSNREKRLPKTDASGAPIKYQEWDVHKKVQGKNRGAERLITGSDRVAYYTSDHYKTFQKVE